MLTRVKLAVPFYARQRPTKLKERANDDDHEKLSDGQLMANYI
jgi:hypothetical protein